MKFLHTMLRVKDLEKSLDFYTNILWMKLLDKKENEEYKYTLAFIWYSENDCQIELTYNWWENEYDHGTAYGHIALEVKDIYGLCEKLKEKWAIVTREAWPQLWGSAVIAFIKDPDGYAIELVEEGTL